MKLDGKSRILREVRLVKTSGEMEVRLLTPRVKGKRNGMKKQGSI